MCSSFCPEKLNLNINYGWQDPDGSIYGTVSQGEIRL